MGKFRDRSYECLLVCYHIILTSSWDLLGIQKGHYRFNATLYSSVQETWSKMIFSVLGVTLSNFRIIWRSCGSKSSLYVLSCYENHGHPKLLEWNPKLTLPKSQKIPHILASFNKPKLIVEVYIYIVELRRNIQYISRLNSYNHLIFCIAKSRWLPIERIRLIKLCLSK